jgi:hypothetical protein
VLKHLVTSTTHGFGVAQSFAVLRRFLTHERFVTGMVGSTRGGGNPPAETLE